MRTLAIIPARGGSKRLPRKNARDFCGKPMLQWSIECAQNSGCFDEIMVSTDDSEIAEIAKRSGASIPFFRSPETSNDHAGLIDVIREVLEQYAHLGTHFEEVCCILATAPFLLAEDLREAHTKLRLQHFHSVLPVVQFGYPIWRSFRIDQERLAMHWPEHYTARSQDLPTAWHDAGQFYWIKPEPCLRENRLFTSNSGWVEIPVSRAQDIDTEEDWLIASMKFQYFQTTKRG